MSKQHDDRSADTKKNSSAGGRKTRPAKNTPSAKVAEAARQGRDAGHDRATQKEAGSSSPAGGKKGKGRSQDAKAQGLENAGSETAKRSTGKGGKAQSAKQPPTPRVDLIAATLKQRQPRRMPMTAEGVPDYAALAEQVRQEIAEERNACWRAAQAEDKGQKLNPEREEAPEGLDVWQAELPCRRPERPDVATMLDYCQRNELGDAELLASYIRGRHLYDHATQEWMEYDGIRWVSDGRVKNAQRAVTDIAEDYEAAAFEQLNYADVRAIELQAEIAKEADKDEADRLRKKAERIVKGLRAKGQRLKDRARQLRGRNRIKNVLEMATYGAHSLGTTGKEWDKHPTLLPCLNGVIDLETGRLLKPAPDYLFKRRGGYEYQGLHVYSKLWHDHLQRVFCGDAALIDYFERVIGYSATGLTAHKEFYCAYGRKANNGKSQTFNAIAAALGDFARTIKVSVLLEEGQKATGPEPEKQALDGPRMAIASEPKKNAKFAVELLKAVTGNDEIHARGMFVSGDPFRPVCKLWLHTNFVPNLPNADRAFQKRLRIIPFEAQFTSDPNEVNHAQHIYAGVNSDVLDRQMRDAGPAILAWIVRCARRYLRDRDMTPPPAVTQWTKEYMEEQDLIGEFIAMCCDQGEGLQVQAKDLYAAFCKFCRQEKNMKDKFIPTQRSFGEDMRQRYERKHSNKVYYLDICPKPEWMTPDGTEKLFDN